MPGRSGFFLAALLSACPFPAWAQQNASDSEFFERRVRPVLSENCYSCHTNSQLGGLRLDSREALLKGGKSGGAIVPGHPADSLLIQAVRRTHARIAMPPQGKLADAAIADLSAWIEAGAPWPEQASPKNAAGYRITPQQRAFWAFQPPVKPKLPKVSDESWAANSIDRYVLAKLDEHGLKPVRAADKRTLIRRATFDLIGFPPTPEEVDSFVADSSPEAFAKVIDRLLASRHYGERWARYWLDLARYADGDLGASRDSVYENAFRYRDWVVQAFNNDLPYDQFVKSQIAGDLLPGRKEDQIAGLGFQALGGPADEQVDVTSRVFLGLTVGCAQCHDHKFDPIPTKDYYSLLGVFKSSASDKFPLVPKATVDEWERQKKEIEALEESIDDFVVKQSTELGEILAAKTSRYLTAAWKVLGGSPADKAAAEAKLDGEVLKRWVAYLKDPNREHPFLKSWDDLMASRDEAAVKAAADAMEATVLKLFSEKKAIDDRNYVKLGGAKGAKDERTRQYTNMESLDPDKFYFWRDLASGPYTKEGFKFLGGVYYFGKPRKRESDSKIACDDPPDTTAIERFLSGEWKAYLQEKRAELTRRCAALPPMYPFLHALKDSEKPSNAKVAIRGDKDNPGEEAPRRFLQVLCEGEPKPFTNGSGRLELAEAIASPRNPLTARVMVNRIWHWHFGRGIVPSPSNFGQLGEKPSHPELLDYLAARFIEQGWSMKAMHREIMLSSVYRLSTESSAANAAKDADNRLLWRANMRLRLDAEALRDALLSVSGKLDLTPGGPPQALTDENFRRTLYTYVGRTKPDRTMALFDFPNPAATSERRTVTIGPLQRLYFLNSRFVIGQATALADRLKREAPYSDTDRIQRAYRLLFSRPPSKSEVAAGLEYLEKSSGAWARYAQVLLASSEFTSVN